MSAVCVLPGSPVVQCEDFHVTPLTEDQSSAMATINLKTVTSTVAFLASDEMAGRNTPSVELEIASAYVAARFQGAGLARPDALQNYYQSTEITQTSPAAEGLQIRVNDMIVPHARILWGTQTDVTIDGLLTGSPQDPATPQPVVVDDLKLPPQLIGNPAGIIAMWSRRVRALADAGASVVLVRTSPDSPIHQIARELIMHPIQLPTTFEFKVPVILVDESILPDAQVQVMVPANEQTHAPVHNVMGILKGSDPELSQQAIIISAHLDHIGTRSDGEDRINNGADDNATGVTAVLTLADAFAGLPQPPRRTLIFMTFWGEEKGLLGSKYYTQNPLWPLDQTLANINIEMIGRPEMDAEGKAWGTGWSHSSLGPQMAAGATRADVQIFNHTQFSEMLYTRSDNYSFVRAGVIAHSFSAGSLHHDYHQPSDEVDKLNLPHMTQIIQGLFAGILPLADGQLTPQATSSSSR